MIAEIGILIAVYVAFRGLESIAATGPGGCHADLAWSSRWGIVLLALAATATAVIVGYDLIILARRD